MKPRLSWLPALTLLTATALAGAAAPSQAAPAPDTSASWPALAERLQPIVDDAAEGGVALGLFVSDLSGGRFDDATLYLGEQGPFTTASTIKLSLAATVLDQVEAGTLALSDPATITAEQVIGGSGVLKDRPAPIETTVGEMLTLMIQVSDNTATNKLVDVVGGFDPINTLTRSAGIAKEDLHFGRKMFGAVVAPDGDLWATPHGFKQLLDLFHDAASGDPAPGFLEQASARELIELMRGQQVKTKLGAVVPGRLIAHKTGENATVSHDLGYLLLAGREVSVGVFTRNDAGRTGDAWYAAADPYVQQVGAVVYDYVLRESGTGVAEPLATTTRATLSASRIDRGQRARLTVRVRAAETPVGRARVLDGRTELATVPVRAGRATYVLRGLAGGTHRIRVVFVPRDATAFAPSTSPVRVLRVR